MKSARRKYWLEVEGVEGRFNQIRTESFFSWSSHQGYFKHSPGGKPEDGIYT